jgi:Uma2 family endonuclease
VQSLQGICIEVLSADRTYDRITKRFVYAAAGVPEYWVVEPAGLVERFRGTGLAISEEVRGSISSTMIPGLVVDLDQVFS